MAEFLDLFAEDDDGEDCDDDGECHELTNSQMDLFSGSFIDDGEISVSSEIPPNPYLSDSESDRSSDSRKRKEIPVGVISPEKKKTGDSPALHWCFTCFNYDDDTESALQALYPDTIEYICYGREICPKTERRHLQGYIKFVKKMRFSQVKKLFNVPPHIEKCKGTPSQNYLYCTKDDENAVELGDLPGTGPPKKQKMQIIIEKLLNGESISEICKSDLCHVFVTNRSKIMSTVADIESEQKIQQEKDKAFGSLLKFKDWQSKLMAMLEEDKGNDRNVFWIYESRGNVGKSYFCNQLKKTQYKSVAYLDTSTIKDLSLLYNGESIVLIDYARDDEKNVNYGILEKLKNGFLVSPKYETRLKMFKSPVICCFANFPPEVQKLSMDRWKIYRINFNNQLESKNVEDFM